MKTTALHICSDFAKQKIYTQLVNHLELAGVSQIVYAPVRTTEESEFVPTNFDNIKYYFNHILRPHHRFFFRTKVRKVVKNLSSVVDLSKIDMIHAHFLFSDGAVAFQLKQKLKIPYIVSVRNTDIYTFMRYRPDLFWLVYAILREASHVIFLSPAYKTIFLNLLNIRSRSLVNNKSVIVPNGVDSEWLKAVPSNSPDNPDVLRLLFVSDFSKNKNIAGLLKAVSLLSQNQPVLLTLVGDGGDGEELVMKLLSLPEYNFVEYLGRINDMAPLRKVYRDHDILVVPSFRETFGVVYIEALSQGLPIIYSRGQGVDGYFTPGTVSESVDPNDPVDIANKIIKLKERRWSMREECILQAKQFNWFRIAGIYKKIYSNVSTIPEGVNR